MTAAVPWLPATALGTAAVAAPVAAAVRGWSETWLAGAGWRADTGFAPVPRDAAATGAQWATFSTGAAGTVLGRDRAMQQLGCALLGAAPRAPATERDTQLLRRVAAKALGDLQARVDGVVPSIPGGAPWRLALGPAGHPLLAIELGHAALTILARQRSAPRAPRQPITPLRAAVADRPLRCAARLGSAAVAVGQLAAIEPGDVLLLDQRVGEPVTLTIEDAPTDLRFALDQAGDRITLHFQDER